MAPFFIIEKFETFLTAEKRFSSHTIGAYLIDLNQFFDFISYKEDFDLNEINHHLVRSWVVELNENKISNKSINRKLASLRTFFKWALKNEFISKNPISKIQGPKQQKKLPVFVKESEILLEKTSELFNDTFAGIRDKLIFEMFYQTGIRLSELIELKSQNVNANSIKVLGKRNKERIIPISENLTNLIILYNNLKNKTLGDTIRFFCLNNGNKLYPKFVYRKINYYLSLVTSSDVMSPHVLRHTFATHMLNNGAGLETLKDLLGHANLAATQVYTHNSFTQLTNIYSSAHPRGRKKN
jgi:integrase/recombinase XerC